MRPASLLDRLRFAGTWLHEKLTANLLRLSIILGILLIPSHKFYDVEHNVYDLLVKLTYLGTTERIPVGSRRIALLLIDDEARRMEQPRRLRDGNGATSRDYLASLIQKLTDLEHRPAVVGLDFRLNQPSDLRGDEALARAIGHAIRSGIRIVLPTVLVDTEGVTRPLLPVDAFLRSGRVELGFTNLVVYSGKQVVRRASVSFPLLDERMIRWYASQGLDSQIPILAGAHSGEGTPYHLSFAAALLMAADDRVVRRWIKSQLGKPPFWIQFPAASHRLFRLYSSGQLLHGAVAADLQDTIVIVGSSYDGSPDRVPTPLSVSAAPLSGFWGVEPVLSQHLPGAIVHAYAVDTLLRHAEFGNPVSPGPWLFTLIAIAIGSLQAAVGVRLRNFLAAPEAVLILPILYAWLAVGLFDSGNGILPIVRPIAGYFVGFAAVRHLSRRQNATSAEENKHET